MSEKVYVFGHQNPDTDSVCSAIAYAQLKKNLGHENTEAYKLGKLNKETEFVLKYFNVEEPQLLEDISPKLCDLDLYPAMLLNKKATLKEAIVMLRNSTQSKIISIVDNSNKMQGILSIKDITNIFLDTINDNYIQKYEIIFKNLINILKTKSIEGIYSHEIIEGNIYIETMLEKPQNLTQKDILVTNNLDLANTVLNNHTCGCIILTDGITPPNLGSKQTCVVSVENPFFKIITYINQAVSVSSLMNTSNIQTFLNNEYIGDVLNTVQSSNHRNFPVIDELGNIAGIMSKSHLVANNKKKVILLDHNERNQSVSGLESSEILEVLDHHRIADIQTEAPLYMRIEPVGCTCTIVYKMYTESNTEIPKQMAGLMLSAILSDTLIFTSPTCTKQDENAAYDLAKIANISDINAYAKEMFLASTSLEGLTPEEILKIDRKKFSFGSNTAYISQVNTLDFEGTLKLKEALFKAMDRFLEKTGAHLAVVMLTDIDANSSEILVRGSAAQLARKAFNIDHNKDNIFLKGVVSRKKQVIPKLTEASQ